jgi:UDP-hydrolysing UDP-N-acetyl-D-glucosamine 2-epimerase
MTRKICIVTGTRAEYGLLRGLIDELRQRAVQLQVVATGMHLSPEFGMTVDEIVNDGVMIAERVEMLLSSDTASGVSKSIGLGLIGFSDAFARLRPDIVVLLGDRFEIFAAAAAALVANIPIAHIHGGETTEGAFDEAIRHSVTKMSHLHFVAAEPYRARVVQLGEHPCRVFLVGGLGVDAIRRVPLMERAELEASIGFRFRKRNLLITFHPVTLEAAHGLAQIDQLLKALDEAGDDLGLIFTLPNADAGGREIARRIEAFARDRDNAVTHASLGQVRYLSCLAQVDAVVGNSSSGLLEAPTFGIGTVNIGDRQAGRLKAATVIDCEPEAGAIRTALEEVLAPAFRKAMSGRQSPYGNGGASKAIAEVLSTHSLEGLLKKRFHDLGAYGDDQALHAGAKGR